MGLFSKPFLPYPSMERQDLTQGQLGSFKFTPVDAVHRGVNKDYLTALAQQDMLTQLHPSAQSAVAMASDPATHPLTAPPNSRSNLASDALNSAVFDQHFKPALEDSRLIYGPAALRSAVESHSPEKTRTRRPVLNSPQPFNQSFVEMDPGAGTFRPSAPTSGLSYNDPNASLRALARSLATEQYAHHNTQIILEQSEGKVSCLKSELEAVNKQNKSLKAQVDMLSGIIKHNQRRLRVDSPTNAITEVYTGEMSQEKPQRSPIFYDVLARQQAYRAAREAAETSAEAEEDNTSRSVKEAKQVSTPRMRATPTLDDTHLFRLDMLTSPWNSDSEQSAISRKLRRHFQETTSTVDSQIELLNQIITPPQLQKSDTLISFSPEEVSKNSVYMSLMAASEKVQQATGAVEDTPKISKFELSETPVLELPASFLAKYKAPPRAQKPGQIEGQTEALPDISNRLPVHIDNAAASEATSLLSSLCSPTRQRTAQLPPTLDLSIRWKVNRSNPVFESEQEKIMALGRPKSKENLKNAFFDHPVRYLNYAGQDLFRTVMIDHIPIGTGYAEVLKEICGGSLEQIQLFGPIGNATTYMTARVVFNHELGAIATTNYARIHGFRINGQSVRVWQVMTQTWPKTRDLYDLVHVQQFTRFIAFKDIEDEQLESVPYKILFLRPQTVGIEWNEDGLPMAEFTSVEAAVRALEELMKDPELGSVKFDFEVDACDRPYPGTGLESL